MINKKPLQINTSDLKKASFVFRAIKHKLRLKILSLIHENGRMNVSSIYKKLGLEQSVTSQHLGILRKAGIVVTERDGKQRFYSVNYQKVKEIEGIARELIVRKGS